MARLPSLQPLPPFSFSLLLLVGSSDAAFRARLLALNNIGSSLGLGGGAGLLRSISGNSFLIDIALGRAFDLCEVGLVGEGVAMMTRGGVKRSRGGE